MGDVAGCFIVGSDASCDGVDEGEVPINQRGEGAARGVAQVLPEEMVVAGWHGYREIDA